MEFDKFNVIVGENASGKSNLIQIFVFLKDIISNGLEYAIAWQGGNKFIKNLVTRDKKLEMEFQFVSDNFIDIPRLHPRMSVQNAISTNHITYKFGIRLGEGNNYDILYDVLEFSCKIIIGEYNMKNILTRSEYPGTITIAKNKDKINWDYVAPKRAGSILQQQLEFFKFSPLRTNQLLAESRVFGFLVSELGSLLESIGIYDFDPKLLKRPSTIRAKAKLEADGSNLSLVLSNILKNTKHKKTFNDLVNDLLPFFKSIHLEKASDLSVGFDLEENIKSQNNIPAIFVSDGTANVMALITCLFLQDNKLTIIEEPERNLHPSLLSRIIGFMQDASFVNQIIITTHNPAILNHVKTSNAFIIKRNQNDGNSEIFRADDSKNVRQFVKNMSLGNMLTKNLLR